MWGWDKGIEFGNELAMTGLTTALRLFDPGHLNPLGQNPLQPILEDLVDRTLLCAPEAPRLYVGATDVESGQTKVFSNSEISVQHLLASGCLPMMFPAITIDGRHYWDGGYSCNPPLAPLLTPRPERLVLIRAQPRARRGVPTSTADIVHRLHEIAFQAPLDAELTLLPRHTRLLDISADEALGSHPLSSKMNTDKSFLDNLFAAGRSAAEAALNSA
jgi:NTE family protein